MTTVERDDIESAAWAADIDIDSGITWNYSGRFMYGKKCFGIIGSMEDYSKFLVQLTQTQPDLAWELAQAVSTDSMGTSAIFYFPGFQGKEE